MSRFDSIVVGAEMLSEHYLAEELGPRVVKPLRAAWAEQEEYGKVTSRRGLLALAGSFTARLVAARETPPERRPAALADLYADVREALGLRREVEDWAAARADGEVTGRGAVHRTATGPALLVLEADDAETVDALLDTGDAGLHGVTTPQGPEPTVAKAVSAVFSAGPHPPLVLVHAGPWLLLAERERWAEGRWLAVDLAAATQRRDTRSQGELETVAALLGVESLVPEEGSDGFLGVLAASVTHAVGVSKDLRDGVRESVEVIGSEVLERRRDRGLADEDVPDLARQLFLQSLRYLYRVLFLLYAEARPELGVLPVGAPEYGEGYGLDRLRELALVDLTSPRSRTGRHLYESVQRLVTLVDSGHVPADHDGDVLVFEPLSADLFRPGATALVDEVGLGNSALQTVLRRLLLSRGKKGKQAGFVSYAQLGINQLGAVYEGLMAYGGFVAAEDLVEVAKDGDPEKGSWMVPAAAFATSGIAATDRVRREDPETGETRPVVHRRGSFVLRLSGRERQRSASYYTPQVLTACVVRHSLAELLDQPDPDGTPRRTTAAQVLDLRVCEPALGSGAFLVEAVEQLADEYLRRRQDELDTVIPPDQVPVERQKVKAYLSLHGCYGVDLNATAIELAEISLWLGCMHPGLEAPWFGLRLRRGNSLIGARRAVYAPPAYARRDWLTAVPTDQPLGTALGAGQVHHFLLPAQGWGAAADAKEAKELAPDGVTRFKTWRTALRKAPSRDHQRRLAALAQRVEALWRIAQVRLSLAEAETRRDIAVWGLDDTSSARHGSVTRAQVEAALANPDGAYQRLRRAMDAWCALWSWPAHTDVTPPTWEHWVSGLEALLGREETGTEKGRRAPGEGQADLFDGDLTWEELDALEDAHLSLYGLRPVGELLDQRPWIAECDRIAREEGYLHWELDFAPVFAERGGFDLQVGNPPWVRPDWDDALALAETDPWFALETKVPVQVIGDRRDLALRAPAVRDAYLTDRAQVSGVSAHLQSPVDRPITSGGRPDAYRSFIERSWRSQAEAGIVGLVHLESHFTDPAARTLRRHCYLRLRRRWQFRNEKRLFDILNTREFGVSVYGRMRENVDYLAAHSLFLPQTVDRSLIHDGSGPEPGQKDDDDNWDVRPHAHRLLRVDDPALLLWSRYTEPSARVPFLEARPLGPINRSSQVLLERLRQVRTLSEAVFWWTKGWNETIERERRVIIRESSVPPSWNQVILQGSNFGVATPLAKSARKNATSPRHFDVLLAEDLPVDARPQTTYRPGVDFLRFQAAYPTWEGESAASDFRLAWREMLDSATVRTLYPCLIPPGTTHVGTVASLALSDRRSTALLAGVWASLPVDYLVRISGAGHLNGDFLPRMPLGLPGQLTQELLLRTLRLNCQTTAYAALWDELYESAWAADAWTSSEVADRPLAVAERQWTRDTPLRVALDRRQALVELDALVAVMLGITAEELCAIYRTQFGVLRKYERGDRYDANGRKVPADVLKAHAKSGARSDLGRHVLPFRAFDREVDMTRAHEEFTRRLAGRQRVGQEGDQ